MDYMKNMLRGLLIGAGAIAPGVSGGALAVIMGVYEKMTYALANLLKDFKKNFLYLLPLGIGGVLGILLFSNVMEYLFANFDVQVRYAFIGLILGTFPMLVRTANAKGFKKNYLIYFVIALALTVWLAFLEGNTVGGGQGGSASWPALMLYGVVVGLGTIVPGISSSVMLIYLGAYDLLLNAISSLNIALLIPIGIGFVLSFLVVAKLLSILFEKAYGITYYAILGFVVGSIVPIFPGFAFEMPYFIGLILMIAGLFGAQFLSKFE